MTDRADVPDDRLDVPATAAVPATRLENPPSTTTTTGGRSVNVAAVTVDAVKPTTAVVIEARTDRVPKSLDFFDSTDQLGAPLKFDAAPQPAATFETALRPLAAARQQIVFEHQPAAAEGRSFASQSKPVKFIEIFGEQDAITSP